MTTETINMRTNAERKRRLQEAADIRQESLTAFILSAAEERAAKVIAEARSTSVTAEFFDQFFDSLAPEPTQALADAAAALGRTVTRVE